MTMDTERMSAEIPVEVEERKIPGCGTRMLPFVVVKILDRREWKKAGYPAAIDWVFKERIGLNIRHFGYFNGRQQSGKKNGG